MSLLKKIMLCGLVFAGMQLTAQVAVSNLNSAAGITAALNALKSPDGGVTISNVQYTGYGLASGNTGSSVGTFAGNFSALSGGMLLSTGKVRDLAGANYQQSGGTVFGTPGNVLANALLGTSSSDAAVLEFDVVSSGNTFTLKYLFASEEYPEQACSNSSDRFGIFISGPGISGYYNMAKLPSGPLSGSDAGLSTIHNGAGVLAGTNCVGDPQFYVNNPSSPASASFISYDGYTSLMTAQASVSPCQTYHVVIVIADGADGRVDSGLMLASGSVGTGTSTLTAAGPLSFCAGGSVLLTAPSGYSYRWFKNGVLINAATSAQFEASTSGNYKVELTSSCGVVNFTQALVVNVQAAPITGINSVTSNLCVASGSSIELTAAHNGGTYLWSNGADTRTITVTEPGDYSLQIIDQGCTTNTTKSIIGNTMLVTATIEHENCYGDKMGKVIPTVTGKVGPFVYSWTGPVVSDYPLGYVSSLSQLCCLYAGVYTLTITDQDQCVQTHSYTVTQPDEIQANLSYGTRGSAQVQPSGGIPPYQVSWFLENTQVGTGTSIENLSTNTYQVRIEDAHHCVKYTPVVIGNGCDLQVNADLTSTTCQGRGEGAVLLTVNEVQAPLQFLWSGPDNFFSEEEDITSLYPGTYSVEINDPDGCRAQGSWQVSSPSFPLEINSVPSCNNGQDGHITATITGGNAGYTFSWTGPDGFVSSQAAISSLEAGIYTLTVTDPQDCSVTRTIDLNVESIHIEFDATPVTCNGGSDGALLSDVWGGTGPYTYSWKKNNTVVSTAPEEVTGLSAGMYELLITDSKGCTLTASQEVLQPDALSYTVSENGLPRGQVQLVVQGGTPLYTIVWSNGSTGDIAKGLMAGQHLAFTATDANGCVLQGGVNSSNPCALTLTGSKSDVSCFDQANGAITLAINNGTGPYNTVWTGPDGYSALTESISGLQPGNYSVRVEDPADACYATASYLVVQPAQLVSVAVLTPVNCNGASTGSILLQTTGGTPGAAPAPDLYLFSWKKNNAPYSGNHKSINNLGAGIYEVSITDLKSCSLTLAPLQITEPPALTLALTGKDEGCYQSSQGSVMAEVSGGVAPYSYSWKKNTLAYPGTGSVIQNLSGGTYALTVSDSKSCTVSDTRVVNGASSALQAVSNKTDLVCNGGSTGAIALTINGGLNPYTIVWKKFGQVQPSMTGTSVSGLTAGEYVAEITDAATCMISVPVTLTEPTGPAVQASPSDKVCSPGSITLSASISGVSYKWFFNGSTTPLATTATYVVSADAQSGYYTVEVTAANGCTSLSVPVLVTIGSGPQLSLTMNGGPHFCEGNTVNLNVQAYAGGVYTWKKDDVTIAGQTTNTLQASTGGIYSVSVLHEGCASTAVSTTLTSHPLFAVSSTVEPSGCPGSATGSVAANVAGGYGTVVYDWQHLAGGNDPAALSGLPAGHYLLQVRDSAGCSVAHQVSIGGAMIDVEAVLTKPLCYAQNNGSVSLTTQYTPAPGEVLSGAGCYSGTPVVSTTCGGGCTAVLSGSSGPQGFASNPRYCVLAGQTYSGGLTLDANSTLVICGTFNGSWLSINGGKIVVNPGGILNMPSAWINTSGGARIENHGTITLSGLTINANDVVDNYGLLTCYSALNINTNAVLNNYSTLVVGNPSQSNAVGTIQINNGILNNEATLTAANSIVVNDVNGILLNKCTVNSYSLTINSGTLNNQANVYISSTCTLNGSAKLLAQSASRLECVDMTVNGNIALTGPASSCARIQSTGTWTHWGGTSNTTGNISLCLNLKNPANLSFTSPVTTNCSCNPGVPPACSISWTGPGVNGQTGTSISNLAAGVYTATINCGACQKVFTYTLAQPPQLTVSTTPVKALCYGTSTGSVSTAVAGGTPDETANPYTYAWSNGANTSSIQNVAAGSYSVIVRDKNNCTAYDTSEVTQPLALHVQIQCPSGLSCIGATDGSLLTNVDGGTTPYTWQWSSGQQTTSIGGLGAGTYTVQVFDANQCSASASYTIQPSTNPCQPGCNLALSLSPVNALCPDIHDGYFITNVSHASGSLVYDWSHLDGNNDPVLANKLGAGTYSLRITDQANGCYALASGTISYQQATCIIVDPGCSMSVNAAITRTCPDAATGIINLQISGNHGAPTVRWLHPASGGTTTQLTNLSQGSYQVQVSEPGCPAIIKDFIVGGPSTLSIVASITSLCTGDEASLTVTGFSSGAVSWTASNGGIVPPAQAQLRTIAITAAGTYTAGAVIEGCSLSASRPIMFSPDCFPKPLCEPIDIVEVEITDNCEQEAANFALANAIAEYNSYIQDKKTEFRENYREHCLKATETLTMGFQEREHHYTLYYYDQAGNLTRTVPPQGVELVAETQLDEVDADRTAKSRTEFTNHTLPSTYTYNSLNQLVAQNIPDHDPVNLKGVETLNSGVSQSNLNFTATGFNGLNGVALGNDGDDGLIYLSSNGGATWSALSSVTTEPLKDILVESSAIYVVGDKGVFLTSVNNGTSWIVKETAINTNLLLVARSGVDLLVLDEHGTAYTSGDNGNTWSENTSGGISRLSQLMSSHGNAALHDLSKEGGRFTAIYTKNSEFWLATSSDGLSWTEGMAYQLQEAVRNVELVNGSTAMGITGGTAPKMKVMTTNSGADWSVRPVIGMENISVRKAWYLGTGAGVALGGNSSLYFNNQQTNIWQQTSTAVSGGVKDFYFASSSEGYVLAAGGLYKTIDLGYTQTPLTITGFPPAATMSYQSVSSTDQPGILVVSMVDMSTGELKLGIYTIANNSYTELVVLPAAPGITRAGEMKLRYSATTGLQGFILAGDGTTQDLYLLGNTAGVYSLNLVQSDAQELDFDFASSTGYLLSGSSVYPLNASGVAGASVENNVVSISSAGTTLLTSSASGGLSWKSGSSTITGVLRANRPQQATMAGSTMYMADKNYVLYTSADGIHWRAEASVPELAPLLDLSASASGVYVAGRKPAINKLGIQYSNDNGSSWTSPVYQDATTARILQDGSTAWVGVNNSKVFRLNAGVLSTTLTGDGAQQIYSMAMVQNNLMAVAGAGTILKELGTFIVSTNRVKTKKMNALDMTSGGKGFAAGEFGVVLKITDNGSKFTELVTPTGKELFAVDFMDDNRGLVGGEDGTICYTTNAGTTWTKRSAGTGTIYGVYQLGATKAMAVGSGGAVYYTNDMNTWNSLTATGTTLYAIDFTDAAHGLIGGAGGQVFRVDFSGVTPVLEAVSDPDLAGKTIRSVRMADRQISYLAGDNSLLLVSRDGAVSYGPLTDNQNATISGDIAHIGFRGDNSTLILSGDNSGLFGATDARYTDRFWYDQLGRLVASQNAKQENFADYKGYSYTRYDVLGRISEVGEVLHATPLESIATAGQRSQVREQDFLLWLAGAHAKREITCTYYDRPMSGVNIAGFTQEELRGRVSTIIYDQDGTSANNGYEHATHYSYDVHGNVKTLIQDYAVLERSLSVNPPLAAAQRYKRLDYDYDLLSGNVHEVKYQEGRADQFYHRYEYDADNRLTQVYTSIDGELWDKEARYNYYRHGPLARVETGELQVAGTDYFYTLQGWIKGVNANTLYTDRDAGRDGNYNSNNAVAGTLNGSANKHSRFALDAQGYSLNYYSNDYKSIAGTNPALASNAALNLNNNTIGKDLFNGNISSMVTTLDRNIQGAGTTPGGEAQLTSYRYDQLNRIKELNSYKTINVGTNAFATGASDGNYRESFTYDANGNILGLTRKGEDALGASKAMDEFSYQYDYIDPLTKTKLRSNRLYHVNDAVNGTASNNFTDDIEDQGAYNAQDKNTWNYTYDEIGNLVKDKAEGIEEIKWNVYGKVKEVKRNEAKSDLEFLYDASGNRIAKIEKPAISKADASTWITTWYIRDATGNIMSTYHQSTTFELQEQQIYGSSRIGMMHRGLDMNNATVPDRQYTSLRGYRRYEGSNHLGNVLSVINDRKEAVDVGNDGTIDYFRSTVLSYSDYYAFGSTMGGRSLNNGAYRFGFNGKEKDNEGLGGGGNTYDYGFRIYNPGLGRFLSVDPLFRGYPWNSTYAFAENTPIQAIDLDGLEKYLVRTWTVMDKKYTKVYLVDPAASLQVVYSERKGAEEGPIIAKGQVNGYGTNDEFKDLITQNTMILDGSLYVRRNTKAKPVPNEIYDPTKQWKKADAFIRTEVVPKQSKPEPIIQAKKQKKKSESVTTKPESTQPAIAPVEFKVVKMEKQDLNIDFVNSGTDYDAPGFELGDDDISDDIAHMVKECKENKLTRIVIRVRTGALRPDYVIPNGDFKGKTGEQLLKARVEKVTKTLLSQGLNSNQFEVVIDEKSYSKGPGFQAWLYTYEQVNK